MNDITKLIKKIVGISLIGDIVIIALAYFLNYSPYISSLNRYISVVFLAVILIIFWPLVTCLFFILKEKYQIDKYSITWIVCLSLAFFTGIIFFAGAFTQGEAIRGNLHPDEMDAFMDFYNSIQYGMKPYQYKTIYPAFISVLYGLFGKFVPSFPVSEHAYEIRASQMGSVIYVIYSVFLCGFLGWLVASFKRGGSIEKICFVLVLFFSRPFLFAFERGNSVVLTLFFIMLFLKWYASPDNKLRLCAYIALGLATGIKIVPFILVLLILRRREYMNAIIASVITGVIFFVPFFFLDGNIWTLANNMRSAISMFQGFSYMPDGTIKITGYGAYVNFVNLMNFLGRSLNFNAFFIGKYLNYLILILGCCIVFAKRDMEEWKAVTILMGLMILCPGFSAIYNLIYMIPPLILYINHYEKYHKSADVFLFLFIVMMVPFFKTKILFPEDVYGVRIATLFEIFSVNLLVIIVILFACYEFIKKLPHRNMMCVTFSLICVAGYSLYYKLQPASADAFYPVNFSSSKAQQGVTMYKGLYKYIKSSAVFTLNREKILHNGLTVTLINENKEANDYEIVTDNVLLKQGTIEEHDKALVYIDGKSLKVDRGSNNDKLNIEIRNKGKQPLTLQYVGVTKPLEKLATATYIDNSSEGFIRENGNVQMAESSRFLFSGDRLKQGVLFRYVVPSELLNANEGKGIIFDLYVNGNKIRSIPIKFAGYHYAIIDPVKDLFREVVNEVEFKLNAFYTNKQFNPDADDKRRGIFIKYFGNVNRAFVVAKQVTELVSSEKKKPIELMIPEAHSSFKLTTFDKREWFYPENNIINDKNICIIYEKNRNFNRPLKLQVEINGKKEVREIENSRFNEIAAILISSTVFDISSKISVMSLKLVGTHENDTVAIQYAGPSILQQDVSAEYFIVGEADAANKDKQKDCLKRTSGLYYNNDVKALQMSKEADILLDNRYMEGKNLEIDFRIPEGLPEYFEDKDKNLEIYLDDGILMSVPLKQGQQKFVVNKAVWNHTKPVSTLTLKSTLYDLNKRVRLPKGLRGRGVEISYIGVER